MCVNCFRLLSRLNRPKTRTSPEDFAEEFPSSRLSNVTTPLLSLKVSFYHVLGTYLRFPPKRREEKKRHNEIIPPDLEPNESRAGNFKLIRWTIRCWKEEKKKMALPDKSVFLMHLSVECLVEMQRSVMHRSQLLSFFFGLFYPSNKIYAFDSIEFGWSPCMLLYV